MNLYDYIAKLTNKVELSEIKGRFLLTGWDLFTEDLSAVLDDSYKEYEHCQTFSFVLDGMTFTAVENPEDGYRSSLGYLFWSMIPTRIKFPPVPVIAKMSTVKDEDILILTDAVSGQPVLKVGTDNTEDYYPSFMAHAMPEHMYFNYAGVSAVMMKGIWDEICAAATANWKSADAQGLAHETHIPPDLDPTNLTT